jgi:hypothetical protein
LDPAANEEILTRNEWTRYRNQKVTDYGPTSVEFGLKFSKWITLTKDEFYYVESTLFEGGGVANIDIGMEIKPDAMPEFHPYTMK